MNPQATGTLTHAVLAEQKKVAALPGALPASDLNLRAEGD